LKEKNTEKSRQIMPELAKQCGTFEDKANEKELVREMGDDLKRDINTQGALIGIGLPVVNSFSNMNRYSSSTKFNSIKNMD
jgi:hypothetical protein